jgi:hypothetical protein
VAQLPSDHVERNFAPCGEFVKPLAEAMLVLLALLTARAVWRDRYVAFSGFPILLAAGISAVGEARGGSFELKAWGVAGVAYVVGAVAYAACNPAHVRAPTVGVPRLAAFAALVLWSLLVDFVSGLNPGAHLVSYGIVLAALGASALIASRGGLDQSAPAYAGLIVVGISDLVGVIGPSPWRPCDQFKCSVLHGLFRGPFPSENFLALIATMTLAWTLTTVRGRTRIWGCALCAATVVATGSRTALIVSAVAVLGPYAAAMFWPPIRTAMRELPWGVAIGLPTATAAIGVYLLEHSSASDFSNRGQVWLQALRMVSGHHLVGVGSSSYSVFQQQGLVSYHFTHSEYLMLLFAGGYGAIVLFALWVALVMRAVARNADSPLAAVPIAAYVIYGLTEVSWNPLAFDSYAWIALALCVTGRMSLGKILEPRYADAPHARPINRLGASTVPVISATTLDGYHRNATGSD